MALKQPYVLEKIDIITANLTDIVQKRYFITDITGIVLNDVSKAQYNTDLLNAYISNLSSGSTLVMPIGTLYINGLIISHSINLIGLNKRSCIIQNVGVGVNAITINANIERGTIRDIAIFGNGTQLYGEDATSGKGIVFNDNSVHWNIDNIWMRGHGEEFIYAHGTGNVNNIYITNCELEFGKKSAIHFYQCNNSNQINCVYIKNCNISRFGTNGIELWGQSISVETCSIQACKNIGIVLDGSIDPLELSHLRGCLIDNNYFEQCNYGFIFCKSIASPYPRYLLGLTISNNYGELNTVLGDTVTKSLISAVEVQAPNWYSYTNYQVSNFNFINNSFTAPSYKAIFCGNNVLTYNSIIQKTPINSADNNAYIGLGRAKVLTDINKSKIVKGITSCINNTYTFTKSANITATTELYFDIQSFISGSPTSLVFPIETDSTNYAIRAVLYNRTKNTTGTYTSNNAATISSLSGNYSYNYETSSSQITTNPINDWYIGLQITITTVGTYFYVGNVEVYTFD